MLQRVCDDPTVREWHPDEDIMRTPAVHAVFDLLYVFRDEVSRVTRVRMP